MRAGTYGTTNCGPEDSGAAGSLVELIAESGATVSSTADGIFRFDCSYVRVQGFKIVGPSCVGCTNVWGRSGSHIEFIANEVTGSICQGVFTSNGTSDYLMARNWVHHNGTSACDRQAHGFYVKGDRHRIISNVVSDNQYWGIQHYNYGRDFQIVGNTITHNGYGGMVIGGNGSGPSGSGVAGALVIANIIAFNAGWGIDVDSTRPLSCSIRGNLFFGNPNGMVEPGMPAGCVGANLSGDPLFVDATGRNLRVQAASPAVDAGDASLSYSPAFDGTARPVGAGPDIGAYER